MSAALTRIGRHLAAQRHSATRSANAVRSLGLAVALATHGTRSRTVPVRTGASALDRSRSRPQLDIGNVHDTQTSAAPSLCTMTLALLSLTSQTSSRATAHCCRLSPRRSGSWLPLKPCAGPVTTRLTHQALSYLILRAQEGLGYRAPAEPSEAPHTPGTEKLVRFPSTGADAVELRKMPSQHSLARVSSQRSLARVASQRQTIDRAPVPLLD